MNTLKYSLISFFLGGLLFFILGTKCQKKIIETQLLERVDTLYLKIEIEKLVPKIVYRDRIKIEKIVDSVKWIEYVDLVDSVFKNSVDTLSVFPINSYQDSVIQGDLKLDYKIETLGFLTNFESKLSIKKKNTIIKNKNKNFMMGFGLAYNPTVKFDLFSVKACVGYRGWVLEGDFKNKVERVSLIKQFYF